MKLYAPSYYREFSCIADKCKHSCCIGWEIDIDGDTLKKYNALEGGYGTRIRESIDFSDTAHFRLTQNERCPHLDGRGLCRIITELGEGYLCDICRCHPRFYNFTPNGAEVGLGMACEVAAELILSSDGYADISEIGTFTGDEGDASFDILGIRARIFSVLCATDLSYSDKLDRIYREYGISPMVISDREWCELLASLEYLDGDSRVKFSCYSSTPKAPRECDKMLERALAYFVYRHCTSARDGNEFRMALGTCLFLERLLASLAEAERVFELSDMAELARIVSSELEYSEDNTEEIKMMFLQ